MNNKGNGDISRRVLGGWEEKGIRLNPNNGVKAKPHSGSRPTPLGPSILGPTPKKD